MRGGASFVQVPPVNFQVSESVVEPDVPPNRTTYLSTPSYAMEAKYRPGGCDATAVMFVHEPPE